MKVRVVHLLIMVSGPASSLAARDQPATSRPSRLPNIVWIIADDHAAYVSGAYGNPLARTPNIDRLAAAGVRFERAYCNSPLCSASRQSFLTGRYPHATGVTLLQTSFPDREVTLAEHLGALGYECAAIGKMHFNNNLPHGFASRIDYPQYNAWLKTHPLKPVPADIEVLPEWRPFRDHARVWLNGFYRPFRCYDQDMPGTWLARQAVEFIDANRHKPFFLIVSFYEPHSPFRFPIEFRNRFKPGEMPLQRPGPEDAWQIPAIFEDLTDDEKRGITAAYYTSTEFLDKNVGLVLDGLARTGLDRDTLICYFGDNGYNLGHHGRFEKHCFYEEAVRVPLILTWKDRIRPRLPARALVEFADIVPTALDLCGLPPMQRLHGRSLRPVIEGKADQVHPCAFSEYLDNEEAMVRTDRYKLVYTTGKRKRTDGYWIRNPLSSRKIMLFDVVDDPQEFHDVADRPDMGETRQHLLDMLEERLTSTRDAPPAFAAAASQLDRIDRMLVPPDSPQQ
jgi:choline-sulfatase